MWFLLPSECKPVGTILADLPSRICTLVKTGRKGPPFLRVEVTSQTPVLPLGTLVVQLPERFVVKDAFDLIVKPKWCFYIALGSDGLTHAILDIRPDYLSHET